MMPHELLRQQCILTSHWLDSQESVCSVAEIEKELADARKEARRLRETSQKGKHDAKFEALLNKADCNREDLTLLLKEKRPLWNKAEEAVRVLRKELTLCGRRLAVAEVEGASNSLETARGNAEAALGSLGMAGRAVGRHMREIRLWTDKLDQISRIDLTGNTAASKKKPAAPTKNAGELQKEIQTTAALAELEERLKVLTEAGSSDRTEAQGWLKQPGQLEKYDSTLNNAMTHLAARRVEAAQTAIESAERLRQAIREETKRNKEATERNKETADAVMQALCEHHYNTPKFGELKQKDPLSGVRIRADVPNCDGKGNIRVDIHFDGTTVFEIENVPEGEETLCRKIIGDVGKAIESLGMRLEMQDWGRAGGLVTKKAGGAKLEREPERERSKEFGVGG